MFHHSKASFVVVRPPDMEMCTQFYRLMLDIVNVKALAGRTLAPGGSLLFFTLGCYIAQEFCA